MTELSAPMIILIILTFLIFFVLCVIWHHITAMRYRKIKDEKGKQYKWYQLFGKLNEIGFWIKFVAALILGFVLFVCLHYLCCTYPHKMERTPDFDYLGVIAGFFAVLVTLLVGWNIYSTIKAKEELQKSKDDIEKRFNERLTKLEECCEQGRQRLDKFDGLEDELKDIIYFEVYFAIVGNELIKDTQSENWIKEVFVSYTNPFSHSLKTIARQFLLAEFSKRILEEKSESLINDVVKKVPKTMVEALQKELSENRDWIQYTESDKINELIDKILESYPKE